MAEDIAMVLVILAALYGVADLIGRLAYRLLFGKQAELYLLTLLTGGREDREYRLRQLAAIRRFLPHSTVHSLAMGYELSSDEQQLVKRLENELRLDYCTLKELEEILHSGLQEKQNTV